MARRSLFFCPVLVRSSSSVEVMDCKRIGSGVSFRKMRRMMRRFRNVNVLYYENMQAKVLQDKRYKRTMALVVLIRTTQTWGHWVVVARLRGAVCYFDPYSGSWGTTMKWINDERELNGLAPLDDRLNQMLSSVRLGVTQIAFNRDPYQSGEGDVASCGKHCAMFVQWVFRCGCSSPLHRSPGQPINPASSLLDLYRRYVGHVTHKEKVKRGAGFRRGATGTNFDWLVTWWF